MENNHTKYVDEQGTSIKDIINRVVGLVHFLWSRSLRIALLGFVLFLLHFLYHQIRKPVYAAETTFVLDTGSGSSGDISSLASVVGINLNGMTDGSSLFEEDNIIELYKSRRMLYETFLSRGSFNGEEIRLITRWGQSTKLDKKWVAEFEGESFSFEDKELTIKHDSILFEVIKDFRDDNLAVQKPDRLLSILSVRVSAKDQDFAKVFNERLVETVNSFYLQAKTKKTGDNLATLGYQADSVRRVLDRSLAELAQVTEYLPNPNPLFVSSQVPIQKLTIDVQASAAVYEEIIKNLEVAKITHRNNTPLIQIIDEPLYPLDSDKDKLLKRIVFSIIFGGFLSVMSFTAINIWSYILKHY